MEAQVPYVSGCGIVATLLAHEVGLNDGMGEGFVSHVLRYSAVRERRIDPNGRTKMPRINWNALFLCIVILGGFVAGICQPTRTSAADNYPSRPIKIIVPAAAGGITDVETRRIAVQLSTALGQSVVVDNRPGANHTIGMAVVAKASPDGYTLGIGSTSSLAAGPALMTNVPYDPIKDFQPITQISRVASVLLVNSTLNIRTISELVAYAKANPGKLTYGSNGPGGTSHVLGELFCKPSQLC